MSRRIEPQPSPSFFNPYHFIPLEAPRDETLVEATKVIERGTLHDRFHGAREGSSPPRYSGRIVCRLTTCGPVVVGALQSRLNNDESLETVVYPFELPDPETVGSAATSRPAVPGSTLRGLVASIVEAASCSTLRILGEQSYSVRDGRVRRAVPGTLHGAVARISPHLVPLNEQREFLTLAECLFGFVEQHGRRGLAGRVRFAHAVAEGGPRGGSWYGGSKPLKILARAPIYLTQ